MKKIISVLTALAVLTSLTSCKTKIQGDEIEVKKLVIELCEEHMKNEMVSEIIVSHFNIAPYLWGNPTYKDIKAEPDNPKANFIVSNIDSLFAQFTITLDYIRVTKKDTDIDKVNCSAVLKLNGQDAYDIEYTAQTTSDNENVYVELMDFNIKKGVNLTKEIIEKLQEKLIDSNKNMILNEKGQISKYITDNNLQTTTTGTGLQYVITVKGNGAKAASGKKVRVHYTGKFLNDRVFDSSLNSGNPIEFKLGVGKVIKGWDEGIALLTVGDKAILIIPSHLAYGPVGIVAHNIPPNTPLVFEVELVAVL